MPLWRGIATCELGAERGCCDGSSACQPFPAGVRHQLGAAAGGLVGQWEGTVDGIGWARIVITGVKPDGRVEGRMEFAMHSFVATFADKPHPIEKTSVGVVSGGTLTLTIDAALGGTYRLALSDDSLSEPTLAGRP